MEYVDRVFREILLPRKLGFPYGDYRNKAANHDRLALHLKNANAQIAELQASLKAYEASEPEGGKTAGEAKTVKSGNWESDVFAEIDR
jgi:hypothetical protein